MKKNIRYFLIIIALFIFFVPSSPTFAEIETDNAMLNGNGSIGFYGSWPSDTTSDSDMDNSMSSEKNIASILPHAGTRDYLIINILGGMIITVAIAYFILKRGEYK
ncbi:hypothetical protein A5819_003663 [Enterococcus sp. 7E2_DIV0204]|uniref:hypothetical protein n=1 Tax=unclassified Enterococcus TaxID=2608891 RepID=UPI000A33F3CC|nr:MULTISPECIES: hypothetical protein [unclassified Enterococcus]OTN83844.1 hypothetical protein A5819_003663 [Enterococcus sp. 7E2_DIV0204]OTP47515.1 hypothetical protein A5884_003486 [Enterococcus sp. 7D2_DIV0200]